jgi:hypothetical protein
VSDLENALNDLKIKHNRAIHEHEEKFNKDAKFVDNKKASLLDLPTQAEK